MVWLVLFIGAQCQSIIHFHEPSAPPDSAHECLICQFHNGGDTSLLIKPSCNITTIRLVDVSVTFLTFIETRLTTRLPIRAPPCAFRLKLITHAPNLPT